MPSKKTEPNTHHHNKVWKHTKRDPAVIKKGLRFALKVSYYTQLKSSRVSCYKTSQDPAFKTDFGYLGLYSSEHEANTDIKRFRCAVDFENDRPGQGRNHSPDKLFSPPSRQSPRISVADQGEQHSAIKSADNRRVCLTKLNVEKILWDQKKKKNATALQRLQKAFPRLPKTSTVRGKRISRYRSARGRLSKIRARAALSMYKAAASLTKELDWYDWRTKVINHLRNHIQQDTTWKLINANVDNPHTISLKQLQLVERKARQCKIHRCILNQETRFLRESISSVIIDASRAEGDGVAVGTGGCILSDV